MAWRRSRRLVMMKKCYTAPGNVATAALGRNGNQEEVLTYLGEENSMVGGRGSPV